MIFKKICALMLGVMLLCATCAEAGSTDAAAVAGKWQVPYTGAMAAHSAASGAQGREHIELMPDGSAVCTLGGKTEAGSWTYKDGSVRLKTAAKEYDMKYDGNALTSSDKAWRRRFVRGGTVIGNIDYDELQAQDMANNENGGMFANVKGRLIGLGWDAAGRAMLAAYPLTGKADVLGETEALDEACIASYLSVSGDTIYYVRDGADGGDGIYALSLATGDKQCLVNGAISSLQFCPTGLMYTDGAHELYMCAIDGSGARRLIAGRVFFPYMIDDKWIIYQDDMDGETLHVRRYDDEYDIALNYESSILPVIRHDRLYYFEKQLSRGANGADMKLCRMNLATLEAERTAAFCNPCMALNSEYFFGADGYRVGNAANWWTFENAGAGKPSKVPVYADEEYLVSLLPDGDKVTAFEVERLSDGAAVKVS